MRRMSFALTTDAILNRKKTVTRRMGWYYLKPGDRIQAVDKIRTKSARKLAVLEVVSVRTEPLIDITEDDVHREGIDTWLRCEDAGHCEGNPSEDCTDCFVEMFVEANSDAVRKNIGPLLVQRIEFRYAEPAVGECAKK